jgi:WD40 repeat protein
MTWECLNCGLFNDDDADEECLKCGMNKAEAMTMNVVDKKKFCPECGHMHKWNVYCHCFTQSFFEEDEEEEEEEEEEEDEEGSEEEDEDLLGEKVKEKGPVFEEKSVVVIGELPTPKFVKKMKYTRCNCKFGVPLSQRYELVPMNILLEGIKVKQYDQVVREMQMGDTGKTKKLLSKEEEEAIEHYELLKKNERLLYVVRAAMPYLAPFESNQVPMTNKTMNKAALSHEPYVDMRNLVPWNVYRPHKSQVDSILLDGIKAYTGGDKRILCSDTHTGETLALITRDSGALSLLELKDGELFASSSNGSTRSYPLNHDPSRIKLHKTYWDHSRKVNTVAFSLPSEGPCQLHGIMNHVCFMYSSSEDRYIKVWSMERHKLVASVTNPALRNLSIQCMTQSERHLFCGTSGGTVVVFTKFDECERDDVHECSSPGSNKSYCLQLTLKLPPKYMPSGNVSMVSAINCCGPNYLFTHLWAGDTTGQMTVWFVPEEGLDFIPAKTWKAHEGTIRQMKSTWKHMISIGDDGNMIIHELGSLIRQRCLNFNDWCAGIMLRPDIPRRLKCMSLVEDYEEGGHMLVGTNYGDVFVISIGKEV